MPITTACRDDLTPLLDIELALRTTPDSTKNPTSAHPNTESPTGGNSDDVLPGIDIALAIGVPARSQHGAVAPQSQGMGPTGVLGHMDITGCHRNDIPPFPGTALTNGM